MSPAATSGGTHVPSILQTPAQLRAWADAQCAQGHRIALVPTMGSLHAGHLSLVRLAKEHGSRTVVSIFVNPTQFGPDEDLAAYPHDLQGDLAKLAPLDVDAVFTPTPDAMYGRHFDTFVVPERLAQGLCGRSRPLHFRGVCTVVLLLLRISRCHAAVFGEKDYQQLQIIKRLAKDLWLDVDILAAPIQREHDGLAMSSRNAYLTAGQRQQAIAINAALKQALALYRHGQANAAALKENIRSTVLSQAPEARIDYIEFVDPSTLAPVNTLSQPTQCAVAVWLGSARLLDNCRFEMA